MKDISSVWLDIWIKISCLVICFLDFGVWLFVPFFFLKRFFSKYIEKGLRNVITQVSQLGNSALIHCHFQVHKKGFQTVQCYSTSYWGVLSIKCAEISSSKADPKIISNSHGGRI